MTSSMGLTDGNVKKATYEYNGLGHRMGQSIATGNNHPASTISYTLDLTRQYHNLLQKTTGMATVGNSANQTYYWDGNVTGMEEEGRNHFYFQDDLGSPMRLADETGRSEEIYGFDEFGNDIRTGRDIRTAHDIFKSPMQSFGFTGYQMDEAGGLYFAQARRYDAGVNAVKGAAFSLPGGFMQWATGPSNTTAQSLMKGYNSNSTNVYGLFYGLIDNGLLAADSTGNLFGYLTASVENSVTEMEKNNVGKE